MAYSCFSTMDSDAHGPTNNISYNAFSLLTTAELKSLRSELRADGEWMRVRLLQLHAPSPKLCPNPRQGYYVGLRVVVVIYRNVSVA